MKNFIYYLIFVFLNFYLVSFAQTHWIKYPGNPVFVEGQSGAWDDVWVTWPFVIHDSTQFIMYYTGFPAVSPVGGHVGRAISPDGINWTRDAENPVLTVGLADQWDDATVFSGPVIVDGAGYKMWYTGFDGTDYRIGLATSLDGIGWIKHEGNPVVDLGESGQWDDSNVALGSVIFDQSLYKMWYVGRENVTGIWRVGHATSSAGVTWERHAENPVLNIGESGEWDDEDIPHGYVLFNENIYEMWYQGYDGSIIRTGYATSPDGVEWTKYAENPVLTTESGWETQTAGIASVLLHDYVYKAWYMGETSSSGRIGYATAPVTINVPDEVETIQAAIDSAVDGNLVLVDEGTYYENINLRGKAITVASRFYIDRDTSHISNTIIDGSQHEDPDSGSVVYFVSGEDTNAVLCGFTITGGSGTRAYFGDDIHWYGGGIFCASGGKIINNIVRDNTIDVDVVYAGGGGILAGWLAMEYVHIEGNTILSNSVKNNQAAGGGISFYCDGKITDNIVVGNAVTATESWGLGGGITCLGYDPIFISVDVYGNQIENNQVNATGSGDPRGYAGGLQYARSNGIINNNTIRNNKIQSAGRAYGGGIFINIVQATTISNNLISQNSINSSGLHEYGGGICYYAEDVAGYTHIYNNILFDNESENGSGGGLSLRGDGNDESIVVNNTIVENKATIGGGVSVRGDIAVKMFNEIVWGNMSPNNDQIHSEVGSSLQVYYSDVQSGFSGEKNIDQDPLFEDTVSFRLTNSSPCIGSGIDSVEISGSWYYCPDRCIYDRPRPSPPGSVPDMGACEHRFSDPVGDIIDNEFFTPLSVKMSQNYPNPFNPITIINYELRITSEVELSIYNLIGQKIATLVDEQKVAGHHQVEWDASNHASGIYYYQIKAGEFQDVKKMILLR